jgi:predicted transcriptional regulator
VLRNVVIAEDLTIAVGEPLAPEDSLAHALARMDQRQLQSWPVVENGILLGMVRRSDLYALIRKRKP